jgi:ketosteroid isomerase-like protein
VRKVIEQFEQGLAERNLAKIEPLMAQDMVAFENGHRNDGWADFRDNHLVPEMQEPAPPMKSEFVRVTATPQMGWGYTKTTMTLTRKGGEKVEAVLWSMYVLEKREGAWKIVALDWSFYVPRPSPPAKS